MTSPPIHLSFAGNGRVVLLTPSTVRQAFFKFLAANRLTARDVHRFESPTQRGRRFASTTLDRLFRRGPLVLADGLTRRRTRQLLLRNRARRTPLWWGISQRADARAATWISRGRAEPPYLTLSEIEWIEHEMNRMLLHENAVLVRGESRLHTGYAPGRHGAGSMRRILYVVRYGMVFELSPLRRETLLQGSVRDIVLEDDDGRYEVVRYHGLRSVPQDGKIFVSFRHRLDRARAWETPLAHFAPRRLFAIRRVAPCDGFCFAEFSELAKGQ